MDPYYFSPDKIQKLEAALCFAPGIDIWWAPPYLRIPKSERVFVKYRPIFWTAVGGGIDPS